MINANSTPKQGTEILLTRRLPKLYSVTVSKKDKIMLAILLVIVKDI